MITGTKSVAGVPAAQRQPRDRRQRRRENRKKQSSDGDDSHPKVDGLREVDDATIIDIINPERHPRHPAITQSNVSGKDRQASRHPGRKQRHIDIRI